MFKKLKSLKENLGMLNKKEKIALSKLIKISEDPTSPPELWEIYPGDTKGEWDFNEDTEEKEQLSQDEFLAIKMLIEKHFEKYDCEIIKVIPYRDKSDKKFWRVFAECKPEDPVDLPEIIKSDWLFWEVFPGEYNYEHAQEIPGEERRIYGDW